MYADYLLHKNTTTYDSIDIKLLVQYYNKQCNLHQASKNFPGHQVLHKSISTGCPQIGAGRDTGTSV
jgi:hypothetical protein